MIVVQILLAFFWMCVVPAFTGCIFTKLFCKTKRWNFILVTATGLLVQYALYEVLALIFIGLDKSFRLLSKLYAAGGLFLAFVGIVVLYLNRAQLKAELECKKQNLPDGKWKFDWYLVLAIFMIGVQLVAILWWATPDSDDAFYSGLSSMSLAGDYVLKYDAYNGLMKKEIIARYAISALPPYQASLQLLCGNLHHLFITHNLFPLFYMPLSYGLFYLVGQVIAGGDRKESHRYLFYLVLLHMFGNTFVFSPQNFLVTRIWQGKALFICISLPVFYLLLNGMFACKKIKERMIYVMLLFLALIATVFMGETGLFLGPLMILAMSLAYGIVAKLEK
ncbi:MAG: hypothetical protein IIV45_15930 [Lachnospiraceae bacterium]|nr:hypothetical protein [Lachnospiraceae bacterium]